MTSAVSLAAEPVTPLELLPQLAEVVDLAVEDEPERAVLVRHRLVGRLRQVDDRQPPVPESDRPVHVLPLGVRPPVRERPRHGGHDLGRGRPFPRQIPADPTHARAQG